MVRLARQALTYVGGNSTQQARRFFLYLGVVVLVGLFFIVPRIGAEASRLQQPQQGHGYAPGPPAKLAFTVQPSNTLAGDIISPPVQVEVRDAFDHLVTTATNSVTMVIGFNPSVGTLSGTQTVAAVNGVATFANLSIDKSGGYTLMASAPGLTAATSSAFGILRGTSFDPVTAALRTMGAQATVTVKTAGVQGSADGVQLNIQHSADVTITSPACVGIFQAATVLAPTPVSGGTLTGCFLLSGNVSGITGNVVTFVVTRVGTGNPLLTFGVGGASGTQFSDAGELITTGITNTLQVSGAETITGTVTLQGRTSTSPQLGHGIATVTLVPIGVTASVSAAGSFTLQGVLVGTRLTASAPGYVSRRTDVVVEGTAMSVQAVQLRCGLVNNDNVVDINDITATVASFGRTVTARVDALGRFVDQNGDGAVNINDITCVASSFGIPSPQPWP